MSDRYPMTNDQPAQIDCRRMDCRWNAGGGNCANVSPAITLHTGGKALCWTSHKREEDDVSEKIEFKAMVSTTADGFLVKATPALRLAIFPPREFMVALTRVEAEVPKEPVLKPCPFCGGEVMRGRYYELYDGMNIYVYSHADNACIVPRVEIVAESQREADAKWNRRDA